MPVPLAWMAEEEELGTNILSHNLYGFPATSLLSSFSDDEHLSGRSG